MLSNLRVARSTGCWAGAGSAELRQCTWEQVYILEKGHSWKKLRRKLHLVHWLRSDIVLLLECWEDKGYSKKSTLFNGIHSLLLASHSALSTPGGSAVRANTSACVIRWHTYCCCRYGRSSRLLLIPLGQTVQSSWSRDSKRQKIWRCKTIDRSVD